MSAVRVGLGAAVVGALLATAGCGGSTIRESTRKPILQAATADVEKLLSYDAATLATDQKEIADVATTKFARTYGALLSGRAGAAIRSQKAVSTATVLRSGTVTTDTSAPEVLLFVRQSTTSTKLAAPRLDFSAVEVHLCKVEGRWRIDSIEKVAPVRAGTAK